MNEGAKKQRPKYCSVISQLMDEHDHETQEELATAIGETRSKVENWLNNRSRLDILNLIKIAKHYDETLDYIVGISDLHKENAELASIEATTGLSEEALDVVCRYKDNLYYITGKEEDQYTPGNWLSAMLSNSQLEKMVAILTQLRPMKYFVEDMVDTLERIDSGASIDNDDVRAFCENYFNEIPAAEELREKVYHLLCRNLDKLKLMRYELSEVWFDFIEEYEPTKNLIARGNKFYYNDNRE